MASLVAFTARLLVDARPPASQASDATAIRHWDRFCSRFNCQRVLTAGPDAQQWVTLFAAYLRRDCGLAPGSIRTYITSINSAHLRQHGQLISPPSRTPSRYATLMRCIAYDDHTPSRPRRTVTTSELYSLVDSILATSPTPASLGQDTASAAPHRAAPSYDQWCLATTLLVAYFGAFRASEIVLTDKSSELCARQRHVSWATACHREVLIIDVLRSKVHQATTWPLPVVIGSVPGEGPARCPVAALKHLRRHPDAPLTTPSSPIFVFSDGVPVTVQVVNRFLRSEAVRREWQDPAGTSSHAVFRYSMASALAAAKVTTEVIDKHCRWGQRRTSQNRYARARITTLATMSELAAATSADTDISATILPSGRQF